jgi:hypothetical protein
MSQAFRLSLAAAAAAVFVYAAGLASAQAPMKQIKLTEKQITGFIAAHKDMSEAFDKLPDDTPDAEVDAKLAPLARKHGFQDHKEYQEVVTNIAMVMFGIDPDTKAFTDPPTLTKRLLESAKKDKKLSEAERKIVVGDLTSQLKVVQPIVHPGNIELVKKYYDKIEPLLK